MLRILSRGLIIACLSCWGVAGCSDDDADRADSGGPDLSQAVKKCQETCSGCCDSNGNCSAPPTPTRCGTGGAQCVACEATQLCTGGACTDKPKECTPESCPRGCCQQDECKQGNSKSACGKDGADCRLCDLDEDCLEQACKVPE